MNSDWFARARSAAPRVLRRTPPHPEFFLRQAVFSQAPGDVFQSRTVAVQLQWDTNLLPALVGAPAATAEAPGQRLELRNPAGRTLLAYSELYAFDAAGKQLSAQLALAGTRLTIHVDDRGATYPVTIDPLIWSQQSKLLSSDGISGDTFASSVAISGDTAIVGDPFHDNFSTNQGAAYVFVRSNTQWTQ